jgi:hypothetical protein
LRRLQPPPTLPVVNFTRPCLNTLATLAALFLGSACELPDRTQATVVTRRADATTSQSPTGETDRTADTDTAAPAGCLNDGDCAQIDACCLTGACIAGTCVARAVPNCCSVLGPCATYTPLHEAACVDTCTEGGCQQSLKLSETRCGDTLWTLPTDPDGLADLVIDDPIATDRVGWRLTGRHGLGDTTALYAGDGLCPTYYNGPLDQACQPVGDASGDLGNSVHLAFDTPPIPLPADRPAVAEIWLWLDIESAPNASSSNAFDGVEIAAVSPEGIVYPRWSSRQTPPPSGHWFPVLVDLSELAGRAARVRISFDTIDGRDNLHEGLYVGSVRILTPCPDARLCDNVGACEVNYPTSVSPTSDQLCLRASPTPETPCTTCTDASACPTTDACDVSTCETGRCVTERILTAACCTPLIAGPPPTSFEAELDATWLLGPPDSIASTDPGSHWHVSTNRAKTGSRSLRFANPVANVLAEPGSAAEGSAWSPVVPVPADNPRLFFNVYLSTEWDGAPPNDNPAGIDLLEAIIRVEDGPASVMSLPPAVLWDSRRLGGSTQTRWEPVSISLAAFVGRSVRVGWRFQTGDGDANDGEGAFIDDAIVFRRCPGCESPDSCGALQR